MRRQPQPLAPRHSRQPRASRSLAALFTASVARFLRVEAAGGLVLLAAAALALAWANSPWSAEYLRLWRTTVTLSVGGSVFTQTLRFWVNEGLMTLFFFVVGLEIHRELAHGALSTIEAALLPVVAALGGMLAPALVFLAIAHSSALSRGWAIPVATDIAFAVGILALLGRRVPRPLRAFLLALAIIDDIGAIIIIALFYSHGLSWPGLALAAAAAAAVLGLARLTRRMTLVYAAAGVVIWAGLNWSGVHPTLAGVILGLLVPATPGPAGGPGAEAPCVRLERALHPWVAYAVMPLFAFANAGIDFHGMALGAPQSRWLIAAIAVALLAGKPLGIMLAGRAAARASSTVRTRARAARPSPSDALPRGIDHGGLTLVGCLGGIGFTMSLFIAGLAFDDEPLLAAAKLGILVGSASSAVLGLVIGRMILRRHPAPS